MPGKRLKGARRRVDNATNRASMQARGTARNTRELVGSFSVDRILPNGINSLFREIAETLAFAAGRGSGREQVWASIKAIVLLIVVSPFTLGYSLVLAVPFVFTLGIGLLRMVPAANKQFQENRGGKLQDRDIPWWRD